MVNARKLLLRLTLASLTLAAAPAYALLGQTVNDLALLSDVLRTEIETRKELKDSMTPLLLAPPVHYWKESRADFIPSVVTMLKDHFAEATELIQCPDCDAWRLHVQEDQKTVIHNGELSLGELARIRQDPRYGNAKAYAMIRETPAGVEMRVISLADGRILLHHLADSSKKLSDVKPFLHYQEERDRRLRGESLHYTFFHLGIYPKPLFQTEFVEQWGDRNQHITGVSLSFIGPIFALGGVYYYMVPEFRRLAISAGLYYPLQNALADIGGGDVKAEERFVLQAKAQFNISNTFGLMAALGTNGELSIGFSFFNPLMLPFIF